MYNCMRHLRRSRCIAPCRVEQSVEESQSGGKTTCSSARPWRQAGSDWPRRRRQDGASPPHYPAPSWSRKALHAQGLLRRLVDCEMPTSKEKLHGRGPDCRARRRADLGTPGARVSLPGCSNADRCMRRLLRVGLCYRQACTGLYRARTRAGWNTRAHVPAHRAAGMHIALLRRCTVIQAHGSTATGQGHVTGAKHMLCDTDRRTATSGRCYGSYLDRPCPCSPL